MKIISMTAIILGIVGIFVLFICGIIWADVKSDKNMKADPLSEYNITRVWKQKCLDSGGIPNTNYWNSVRTCDSLTPLTYD